MFRETLLESSISRRKGKRWPMALAFTAEVIVAALLVALPLLSTGVISVSAHVPRVVIPLGRPDVGQAPHPPTGGKTSMTHELVVPVACMCPRVLPQGQSSQTYPGPVDPIGTIGTPEGMPNLPFGGPAKPPALGTPKPNPPVVVSHLSEAQLLSKVEPIYPHLAVLTQTQGEVRLHAIIARDGSIQSLSVTSGTPILARAALDAVRQWRYKPYYLNGEPVEVETFIVVNFKKTNE